MVKFTLLVEKYGCTGATQAFEAKVPLPNMTYERGSAQGNGVWRQPQLIASGNLLLTISSLSAGNIYDYHIQSRCPLKVVFNDYREA